MIIVLGLCVLLIGAYLIALRDEDFMGIFWVPIFGFVLVLMSIGFSYDANLELRTHYETVIIEYADAVTYYKDKVVVDCSAITDFRYKEMGEFVRDLRDKTVWHNQTIIKKRMKKRSPFFNWLVLAPPEDVKMIRFKDVVK